MKQNAEVYRTRRLSKETLERIKQWSERHVLCKSPHCGDRCVLLPEKQKDK